MLAETYAEHGATQEGLSVIAEARALWRARVARACGAGTWALVNAAAISLVRKRNCADRKRRL